MRYAIRFIATLSLVCLLPMAYAADSYTQQENLVYGESHGTGLLMDVFTPSGDSNGLAIVDIASGAWHSDRGKIRDHKMAMMYQHFCGHGYTVFAIRPGSVSRFTGEDMVANVHAGIRHVKANALKYNINPGRIGLTGASAGGHLAAMTVMTAQGANSSAKNDERFSTDVAAVGIFFPPTNFLLWGDAPTDLGRMGALFFPGGLNGQDEAAIRAKAEALSPALLVKEKTPPFLIWHGDADPLVPLQQSEFLVEKLRGVGTDVEFYVKEGGAHPWLTIPQEVKQMAEWFDTKLIGASK